MPRRELQEALRRAAQVLPVLARCDATEVDADTEEDEGLNKLDQTNKLDLEFG